MQVRVRHFICNTPSAYAVISVLHRPIESAADCRHFQATHNWLVAKS
jgi:hypothetical protein